jgi:GntR family carbon starvation induced transcriptional regulator
MAEPHSKLKAPHDLYATVKRDIIQGIFAPGQKLVMSTLKERYRSGVGPMREVLSQLVAEHLVIAVNQKGYRVAPMSIEEMHDIYDARANLEAMILQLAIERGDDSWEAMILARAHTLSKVVEVQTQEQMLQVWDDRHKAFHASIASGCRSKHLMQLRSQLLDQSERYRHLWLKSTVLSPDAVETKRIEHEKLVRAILERDAPLATTLMRDHLLTPLPIITEIIRSSRSNDF